MRKSLAIAWVQFRITFRSKAALLTMFAMPLTFMLIFGLLLGGGSDQDPSATPAGQIYPVAIIDQDRSLPSALLVEALGREPNLALIPGDRARLDKLFADRAVLGGLVIPQGFGEAVEAGRRAELELITHRGANLELGLQPLFERAVTQLASDYRLALRLAPAPADEAGVRQAMRQVAEARTRQGVAVMTESVARPVEWERFTYNALDHSALGYTVMSVMMMILLMAGAFLHERQQGTWGRLLAAPTDRVSLLAGYLLSFLLTGMVQFAILVLGTRWLFRISWGPLLPLFTVGAAVVLAAAGIGLFFAGIVRTYEQQQTLGVLFVVATSMLGGLFFPLEIMSPAIQRIAYLTPQAWAMQALKEVALRGGSWNNLALPLSVLLALAVIFTAAGLLRVRYE